MSSRNTQPRKGVGKEADGYGDARELEGTPTVTATMASTVARGSEIGGIAWSDNTIGTAATGAVGWYEFIIKDQIDSSLEGVDRKIWRRRFGFRSAQMPPRSGT